MTPKQLGIVASVVALVLVGIIVLLVTGGPPAGQETKDSPGDVEVAEGPDRPTDSSLADIREAKVELRNSQIVFEAEMAAPIPKELEGQTMEWRWEILEGGTETWLVTASISVGEPHAAVVNTRTNYGAGTIDDTMPGGIDYTGNTIYVRLNPPEIKNFPDSFTWRLETSLDANRMDPGSATASDTAPESGLGEYPPS